MPRGVCLGSSEENQWKNRNSVRRVKGSQLKVRRGSVTLLTSVRRDKSQERVDRLPNLALALVLLGCCSLVLLGVVIIDHSTQAGRAELLSTNRRLRSSPKAAIEDAIGKQHSLEQSLLIGSGNDSEMSLFPAASAANTKLQQICYQKTDFGLVSQLLESATELCRQNARAKASNPWTQVTLHSAPGLIRATLFSSLTLDLTGTYVAGPIHSIAEDGGNHDPRFVFLPTMIHCRCPELAQLALSRIRTEVNQATGTSIQITNPLRIWHPTLVNVPSASDHDSTLCASTSSEAQRIESYAADVSIPERVILLARKEDHNPFFQISSAFNAWILMKTLSWDPATTQLVHLDYGYPTPVDELHQRLLSPRRPIISGKELMGKRIEFTSQALLPPFESDGPLMQELDVYTECTDSKLLQEFRLVSLKAFNVTVIEKAASDPLVVTVISRRPYDGRVLQRIWRNEDEILRNLRHAYAGKSIVFRSVDFVALNVRDQMRFMLESDVVMGMHGAGMVNALWTRPETLVLEIFPRMRLRWGYRNLCKLLGRAYKDFRGGVDIPTGDQANWNDKLIEFDEFFVFFNAVVMQHLAAKGRSLMETQSGPSMAV